jgi:hypothetical protein
LKNAAIVEAYGAESGVIRRAALRGVFGQLHDVVEHDAVSIGDGRSGVVVLESIDHVFVESDATQKLCVRFDSIVAAVSYRDHGGDHFMLIAGERQVGREQDAVGAEGVEKRVGNQGVRSGDASGVTCAVDTCDGSGVFDGIKLALGLHGLLDAVVFIHANGFDPGHFPTPFQD